MFYGDLGRFPIEIPFKIFNLKQKKKFSFPTSHRFLLFNVTSSENPLEPTWGVSAITPMLTNCFSHQTRGCSWDQNTILLLSFFCPFRFHLVKICIPCSWKEIWQIPLTFCWLTWRQPYDHFNSQNQIHKYRKYPAQHIKQFLNVSSKLRVLPLHRDKLCGWQLPDLRKGGALASALSFTPLSLWTVTHWAVGTGEKSQQSCQI